MSNRVLTPEEAEQRRAYRDKLLSVGVLKRGRTRPQVREYRDEIDGHRVKATTDVHGNIVTEHNTKDDRVDVEIRPEAIEFQMEPRRM